eukprot:3757218-Amphidinium_carterae.1
MSVDGSSWNLKMLFPKLMVAALKLLEAKVTVKLSSLFEKQSCQGYAATLQRQQLPLSWVLGLSSSRYGCTGASCTGMPKQRKKFIVRAGRGSPHEVTSECAEGTVNVLGIEDVCHKSNMLQQHQQYPKLHAGENGIAGICRWNWHAFEFSLI